MRRGSIAGQIAASPTLVGAVTVMIVILAIFLAYNANTGLPFVPSYRLSAEVPDAAQLVPGNEVRVGGVRVGQIEDITPVQDEDGAVSARLDLKLDVDLDPLPDDSTMVVRQRSALGLKYLEITKGTSEDGFAQGATIPQSAAHPEPVDFDQLLSTFDEPTRVAIQENLVEFGNALAGRGPDLNEALGALPDVVRVLRPVMRNIGSSKTGFEQFITGSAAAAAEVAPVAEVQGHLFVSLDTTFTALAEVADPFIKETISETPPTFAVGERALPVIRPFLAHSAALFTDLRPAAASIRDNAPQIAATLENGTPVLRDSPALNDQLAPTAASLRAFNDNDTVRAGLDRLQQTTDIFGPTIKFLAPAQTVCNYPTILFSNAANLFSQGADGGTWQRFTVFEGPAGPNSERSVASGPANGGPDSDPGNYLHYNPYPNTAAPGQKPKECEAGNEPYLTGQQVIGNVPGDQGTSTALQPGSDTTEEEGQ
jgi:virulence factor Mce-like protein